MEERTLLTLNFKDFITLPSEVKSLVGCDLVEGDSMLRDICISCRTKNIILKILYEYCLKGPSSFFSYDYEGTKEFIETLAGADYILGHNILAKQR